MAKDGQQFFERDPARQRLLQNKLGALLTWIKPALTQTVGPFEPFAFDSFDAKRIELVSVCVDRLSSLSDDQIAILSSGQGGSFDTQEWPSFQRDEISYLLRKTPEWYTGGFGHPEYMADFQYWTKMSTFQLGELTCLSVGISPNEFTWNKLYELSSSKNRLQFLRPLEFLVKRYEQLHRKFGRHGRDCVVSPRDFLEWANQFEFEIHPRFLEPLKRFHPVLDRTAPAASFEKNDRREIDSIAQLFTAMAIEQFGYVPDAPRNPTTKEIVSLAASLGISITEDTVLKYLRIGAKFISPDWKPHQR